MMKLRLVKVVCQPVFVVDDGDTLQEVPTQPVTVSAKDWPGYPGGAFLQQAEALQSQLNGGAGD